MVDYNCIENHVFLGDISCCQNKANPVSHGTPPPMDFLPPDKIPYGKSSPSMGFLCYYVVEINLITYLLTYLPPPQKKTSRTCCPNSTYGICVGGDVP